MTSHFRKYLRSFSITAAAAMLLTPSRPPLKLPPVPQAMTAGSTSASSARTTRAKPFAVNVPLDLAEKVLPAINKDRLHNGKVRIDHAAEMDGVDCRALLDAIKNTKDGEFVTVQAHDSDVKVAKQGGYMLIHVTGKRYAEGKAART